MNNSRSDFLPNEITAVDISGWADILPRRCRVLAANLFADLFIGDTEGAVHMLEVSAASSAKIAFSEEEFRQRCVNDEDGWLLRPLADQCRAAGMNPTADQCYAFTQLPFLGGEYKTGNIWLCSWREWISYTASVYAQTKDFPDGSAVSIRIVD